MGRYTPFFDVGQLNMYSGGRTIRPRLRTLAGSVRSAGGMYLVELMVAVMVSSILAAALAQHLGETMKLTTGGQNQLIAAAIAQELVDVTRNTNYTKLCTLVGQNLSFNVNDDNGGNPLTERPLMMDVDSTSVGWSGAAVKNKFADELHDSSPTVQETISNAGWGTDEGGQPAGLKIDILVHWNEQVMTKSFAVTTYISRHGIHNY